MLFIAPKSPKAVVFALLFALHLVLQPLAAASMCGWGVGGERMACCSVDPVETPARAQSTCCGSEESPAPSHPGADNADDSKGPRVDKQGCDCEAAPVPPVTTPPNLTEFHKSESALVALPVGRVDFGVAVFGSRSFKAPKDPPRGKARAAYLLNRVFRL